MRDITQARLQELFIYNEATGVFTRRTARGSGRVGSAVGYKDKLGYIHIHVDYQSYLAHRLAFLYMTGDFPTWDVDHIDRNPSNNKWDNLRDVTRGVNLTNCKTHRHNTSGLPGVRWDPTKNKWIAYINKDNRSIHLGCFATKDEALKVRLVAEETRKANPTSSTFYYKPKQELNCVYPTKSGKWRVVLRRQEGFVYLGTFPVIAEALAARDAFLTKEE